MTKHQNKKAKYFDQKEFVDAVIKDSLLDGESTKVKAVLAEEIERRLGERVMATVISSFQDRDLALLEKLLADHPELDDLDAIMVVSGQVPGLKDKIMKAINDLYQEMVYDATQIHNAIDSRTPAANVTA